MKINEKTKIKIYPINKELSHKFSFRKVHDADSGIDIITLYPITLPARKIVLIDTGYAFRGIEPAFSSNNEFLYELQIRSRSGLAKKGIIVANQPGTIDAGYRGNIGILLYNTNDFNYTIPSESGICQLVVVPISPSFVEILKEADMNPLDDRGTSGFGSTDKGKKNG